MAADFTYEQPLLQAQQINLTLGGNQILRDVNLEVRDIRRTGKTTGQICSVLGKSGAGKTQLFRILAGLNPPTSGQVLICERGSAQPVPVSMGKVGVVAQSYPLFEHRTVLGNLVLSGKLAGLTFQTAEEKARGFLERFGLADKADVYAAELSGGQRQRVAISQQLMRSPMFLCLDEPFSGLDPVFKDKACDLITEVAGLDEFLTIIVITHDISAAVQISDLLWLMGRDHDDAGKEVPGSYIKEQINLAERGLAWKPNITKLPEFAATVQELREKFNTL